MASWRSRCSWPSGRRMEHISTSSDATCEARAAAGEPWDPCAVVALCREADEGDDPALAAFARELQHREWELLFDRIVRSVCDD